MDLSDVIRMVQGRIDQAHERIRSDPRDGLSHCLLGTAFLSMSTLVRQPAESTAWARRAWKAFDSAITLWLPIGVRAGGNAGQAPIVDAMVGRLKSAYRSGDPDPAAGFATRRLDIAGRFPPEEVGDAVFQGNHLLGLIALERGDIAGAKEYCLRSAATAGSPTLASFGPSTRLASRLLEKGEAATVLAFLDRCKSFWTL